MLSTRVLRAFAVAAGLLIAMPAAAALAQETFVIVPDNPGGGGGGRGNAVATSTVNVRSGPSTRYAVVDVLRTGDNVRISRCTAGWCFIDHRGPSGWVSQNFLRETGGRPPAAGGGGRQACFYDDTRFRGRSFCARPGDSDRNLGAWNNRISSISIRGGMTVQVCTDRDARDCQAFNRDTPTLPRWLDRNISSYRVFQ